MAWEVKAGAEPVPGFQLVGLRGHWSNVERWEATDPQGKRAVLRLVQLRRPLTEDERRGLAGLRRLHHHRILPLRDLVEGDGLLAFVAPRFSTTLADRLRACQDAGGAGVPAAELARYLQDAGTALEWMAQMRRSAQPPPAADVQPGGPRPEEFILDPKGGCRLDPAAAMFLPRPSDAGLSASDAWYLAPEQTHGTWTERSEQYALAAAFVHLAQGRPPLGGESAWAVIAGHLTRPPDVSGLPEAVRPIALRALAKDPEQRWESLGAFVNAWAVAVLGPVAATLSVPAEPAPPATAPSPSASGSGWNLVDLNGPPTPTPAPQTPADDGVSQFLTGLAGSTPAVAPPPAPAPPTTASPAPAPTAANGPVLPGAAPAATPSARRPGGSALIPSPAASTAGTATGTATGTKARPAAPPQPTVPKVAAPTEPAEEEEEEPEEKRFLTPRQVKGLVISGIGHAVALILLALWVFYPPVKKSMAFDTRLGEGILSGSEEGTDLGRAGDLDAPLNTETDLTELKDATPPKISLSEITLPSPNQPAQAKSSGGPSGNGIDLSAVGGGGGGRGEGFGIAKFGNGKEKIGGVNVKVGDPQFTLIWDNGGDLDLHVLEPGGSHIFWLDRVGRRGGEIDVDDTDGYGPENIYWPQGQGPPGEYKWFVHYYPGFNSFKGPANWKVRVKHNGKVAVYKGRLDSLDKRSKTYTLRVDRSGGAGNEPAGPDEGEEEKQDQ